MKESVSMEILKISDLLVNFDKKKILDFSGQDITISRGDKVALLGKNGAGKTTLVNCILGELSYTGEIKRNFSQKDIGIVFQRNEYSSLLKVYELIELVTDCKKNSRDYMDFCDEFELEKLSSKYIKDLSIGERQRLTVGLVAYQKREIYFLDELTSGLDYEKRKQLLDIIKKRTANKTVIQITHYFDEVENWANRIIAIDSGRLIFSGTLGNFKEKYKHHAYIRISGDKLTSELDDKITRLSLYCNNGEIIVSSEKKAKEVSSCLTGYNIDFQYSLQNIYSTYLLAINEGDF